MNNDISNITRLNLTSAPHSNSTDHSIRDDKSKVSVEVARLQVESKEAATLQSVDPSVKNKKEKSNVVSLAEAEQIVEQGNKILSDVQRNLQFKIDEATKQVVVSVVDKKSGEILRQIPSEEILALAKRLKELDVMQVQGIFLKERA